MFGYRCTRLLSSQAILTGATTLIGLGFIGIARPAQAQQEAVPLVQIAKLTVEQETALRAEATAPLNSPVPVTTPDMKTRVPSALLQVSDQDTAKRPAIVAPSLLKAGEKCGQLPPVGMVSPFPISVRLGAMLSPQTKFDGGIDVTLTGVHLMPSLTTRIDADAILSANLGGVSTLFPITIDQIFSQGLVAGSKVYFGAGVGPYIGSSTRLGGKVFVGAGISSRLTGELSLHFPGYGDPLVTLQARLGL